MLRQGSTPFWARLEAIAGPDGETGMPVSRTMISDITERKRAEEEREKLQAQLAQAQKMESVGRLAGGVAHDFNNLLTVINGYSALLASGMKLGDPVRTSAEAIIAAGESAASLVRQLLAFSRQQALSPKALNLNDVVASAESMLRRLVGENVDLLTDLGSGLDFVVADPHMLEQVIVNLAVNARDAMPHGGLLMIATTQVEHGSLCPTCGERVTPGRYVRLTVRDTGTGFDETVRSHLFEPFFTTKEAGEGTGLGLATAQGIVRQSGGHIHAESVPGKGAAFDVYLPAVDREPNVVERGEVTAQETGGSETILVVEDQAEVRRFIGTLLASYGYRVLQASGAEEALALCAKSHVDLLLTDVVMPGISGPELAAGALVLRPRMKTLFMSGYSGDTVLRDGPDPPADAAFIQKPFTPRELAVDVRRVLGRSSE
jgi:signal transduction histidine kinase/CheY-like chemotaxis protein